MSKFIAGVFIVLHGLVHLLYSGQSRRLFELQPGMVWPDSSWVFSKLLGDETTRLLASVLYTLAAIGFVVGGVGIFVKQAWWRPATIGSAMFSAVIVILFWNGQLQKLNDQGLIALIINMAILIVLLVLRWPSV